jgi:hypothetical protein
LLANVVRWLGSGAPHLQIIRRARLALRKWGGVVYKTHVPLPLVAVVLPQETPPPAAEALIQACRRAYVAGNCDVRESPSDPETLIARVRWISSTEAEVSLGLRRWNVADHVQRQLAFEVSDLELERHRTIGFALGTLASTVAEVTRVEREAQAAQGAQTRTDAAANPGGAKETSTAQPNQSAPPNQTNQPPAPAAATRKPRAAAVVAEPRTPSVTPEATPLDWRVGYSLGALIGTGFETPRYGGAGGVRFVAAQRWVLAVAADYAAERNIRGASPSFLRVFGMLGVRSQLGPIDVDWLAAGAAEYDHISHTPTRTEAGRWVFAPGFNIQGRARDLTLSPWLSVGGTWSRGIQLFINNNDTTLSSFNVVVTVGASIESSD